MIRPPYVTLWMCAFALTVASAALIQFVVLGQIFPEWSNGRGLLLNTDSIAYHNMAIEMANRVATEGWEAWELAPKGQFSAGFAAAHYVLAGPHPWVLIPTAATATAFSVLILLRIGLFFTGEWRLAAVAAAPYVLFPSSAFWYSQLLKDTYFNLGILLFGLGWMFLVSNRDSKMSWRNPALGLTYILLGYAIMGIIRPYSLALMWWSAIVLTIISVFFFCLRVRGKLLTAPRAAIATIVIAVVLTALHEGRTIVVQSEFMALSLTDKQINVVDRLDITESYWKKTSWIPSFLDRKLATLAGVRHAYIYSGKNARSEIDNEYDFRNSREVLRYLPRAAQIGFLAPFPIHWLGEGSTRATTAMRKISMVEMLATYLALLFVPYSLWRWRRSGEIWILVTFCLSIIMVYSVATPNVGTLYRIRYAYLMPFVTLGILAMGNLWRKSREARNGARLHETGESLNS